MNVIRHTIGWGVCIGALALVGSCADGPGSEPDSSTSRRPLSQDPPPTLPRPTQPPTVPSDPTPVDIIAGRVIDGGPGPCFTVETDDGLVYAVQSEHTGPLEAGTTVRVKVSPTPMRADCPGGRPVHAEWIETVG